MNILKCDFLVIGSGIAGLSAANVCGQFGNTFVITKGKIQDSATWRAQGGIAVAMQKNDSPELHFDDTVAAGDGLCDPNMVRILVEEGPVRVQELIKMGAHFDRENNDWSFTIEAAHQRARVLHVGDATGKEIETVLYRVVRTCPSIEFIQDAYVLELNVDNGHCTGCTVLFQDELAVIHAKSVILATGGCGQLYRYTTNPAFSIGSGVVLAYQSGCTLQDLEFIQFHPTALYEKIPASDTAFLITEAVRGEGALLRNHLGHRFMPHYHEKAELAPRDVVARAIVSELSKNGGDCVFLDLSPIQIDIEKRFPTIFSHCLNMGLDVRKDWIPVIPAAHYAMGGVQIDEWGQTNVAGLLAAGEVASSGLHGANRLASNSLLEGLVFGYRAGIKACEYSAHRPINISKLGRPHTILSKEESQRVVSLRQAIQDSMSQNVGIIRSESGLTETLALLHSFRSICDMNTHSPEVADIQNMIQLARLITQAALDRTESRGCHCRLDYPQKDSSIGHLIYEKSRTHVDFGGVPQA